MPLPPTVQALVPHFPEVADIHTTLGRSTAAIHGIQSQKGSWRKKCFGDFDLPYWIFFFFFLVLQ